MTDKNKKLFLLDAMALIYRAHFAFSKNPRINSKGMNTGAILGFTNTLLEVLNKEKPSHIAVAFDTSAPTFRHKLFPEYKAQREESPEDIRTAIPIVKEEIRAFNIPVIELDGFEADDIIGTLAKKAASKGFKVYMMTSDKDYAQLVEDNIILYKPAYMGNAVDKLGIPEVLKKFDIENVDQVRDFLGLQGDASDNIPGIPGIGPKTAVKLLKEYGSLEKLLDHAEELKGKQKENVINYRDQAILSKHLATIVTDVPVEFDEEKFAYKGFDEPKLKELFDKLEFRNLGIRVFGGESKTIPMQENPQLSLFGAPSNFEDKNTDEPEEEEVPVHKDIFGTIHDYHLVDSPDLIRELSGYLSSQKEFCFDTETTSLNAREAKLVGISFAYVPGEAYYVPIPGDRKKAKEVVRLLKPVLENDKIRKIGQNIKYDILVLKNYDVNVGGDLFDTMLAHYLFEPDKRHNMDVLAETYLHYKPVSIESLIGKKGVKQGNMRDVDVEKVVEYAGEDADVTLQLKKKFEPVIKEKRLEKLFHKVEIPLIRVLAAMEYEGVMVDEKTLKQLSEEMAVTSKKIEKEIYELAGIKFNISSPK